MAQAEEAAPVATERPITEVTPAMIEAGVTALLPWYGLEPWEPRELRGEAVAAVYEAMEAARVSGGTASS
jgi:hypothetical protein